MFVRQAVIQPKDLQNIYGLPTAVYDFRFPKHSTEHCLRIFKNAIALTIAKSKK